MSEVLRFALLGLAAGAMYALSAQGLILIYRGSGVLNFAHGAMAMISAFMFYEIQVEAGAPTWVAVIAGLATGALLGLLVHVVFMRRLSNSSPLMRLIATLGILAVLQASASMRYGTDPKLLTSMFPTDLVEFGDGVVITADRLILVGIVCVVTAVLWAVYKYTRFGIATTATAENPRSAAATGWSPDRVAAANWALGGALAAGAGILLAPIVTLQVIVLTQIVVAAFAGALIANFTSFPIALLGGLGVGVAESLLTRYVDIPGFGSAVPFLIIVVVLALRGRGLPVRGELFDRLPSIGTGVVRARIIVPLFLVQAALLLFVFDNAWLSHWTNSMIFAVVLLSIVVLTGYAGQLSLAQIAVGGVGALIAARLISAWDFPYLLAMAIAIIVVVPVGMLVALPALRTRGAALAVATLGIGMAVQYLLFGNPAIAGSSDGTTRIGFQSIFGIEISGVRHPDRYAVVVLIALTLTALLVASIRRGRAGRRLIAVRENERAATSLGISVVGAKLYAFGVAAGIAALGGILLALQGTSVQYEQFGFLFSVNVVLWTVVGGLGFVAGPLLGSTLAPGGIGSLITDQFSAIDGSIELIGGVLLLLIILLNPDGMASENVRIGRLIAARFRRRPAETPEEDVASEPVAETLPDTDRRSLGAPLEIRDLTVRFGGVTALDSVSLAIKPGTVHGLIGPNGAGKTTFVDAITGFVPPATGVIELDGDDLTRTKPYARARLGVVRSFQSLELFEDMTIRENLDTACDENEASVWLTSLAGGGKTRLTDIAHAAIAEFGLEDDLERLPRELPYGQRRLVGIARAVAASPRVLLLDEPAAGLDDAESRELGHLIRLLAERWGLSILLIEHNVDLVMRVSDEITVLNFGKTIAYGSPAEIRTNDDVRAAYLGEPVSADGGTTTHAMEEVR